jgi:hypothetical protein
MSETPQGDDARRIVDELEEKHVDVGAALHGTPDDEQENLEQKDDEPQAEDEAPEVPGSPEPTD